MFAYTYSQLSGAVKFDNGGYHQITLESICFVNLSNTIATVQQLINFSFYIMLVKSINGKSPSIPKLLCCRKITIVGDVSFGENCSVWFNAVIRGDVNFITIGNKVNIQDGAVIHCTYKKHPTIIGNNALLATTRSYTDVQFMITNRNGRNCDG
jgi:acetyltransferase-like isoleucine patch superfamily enzyme